MRLIARTITTKRLNKTELKAECSAGSLVVAWQEDLDELKNHRRAMIELAYRLGWFETYLHGNLDENTHVFVMALPDGIVRVSRRSEDDISN